MAQKSTKICSHCKQEKVVSDFYSDKRAKDGLNSWCKNCGKEYRNNWRRKHPEKQRINNRRRHSGMTADEYQEKMKEQNECCAICGEHKSKFMKGLGGDHNHITKEKRGLLCPGCNTALGFFKTDEFGVEFLCSAISYMRQYENQI